jgi:hypothetical protein
MVVCLSSLQPPQASGTINIIEASQRDSPNNRTVLIDGFVRFQSFLLMPFLSHRRKRPYQSVNSQMRIYAVPRKISFSAASA